MQIFLFFSNFVYFLLRDRLNIHDFHSYLIWYWFVSSSNDPSQKYLNLLIFNNFLFFLLLEVLCRNFFLPFEILCCSIFSHSSFSLYWIYLPCITILLHFFFLKKRCVFFRGSSTFFSNFLLEFSSKIKERIFPASFTFPSVLFTLLFSHILAFSFCFPFGLQPSFSMHILRLQLYSFIPKCSFFEVVFSFFDHYFCSTDSIVLGISQQNKKEVLTTAAYFKVSAPVRSQGQ